MAEDAVLFHHRFESDSTTTDRVEEIRFEAPVYLTGFALATCRSAAVVPRLRLFAKDALCLAGGRFVPLYDAAIEISLEGTIQHHEIPKTVSDHVVIRGPFETIELSLIGRSYIVPTHEPTKPKEMETDQLDYTDNDFPFQCLPESTIPFLNDFPSKLCDVMSKIATGVELTLDDIQRVTDAADDLCSSLDISHTPLKHPFNGDSKGKPSSVDAMVCTKTMLKWMRQMSGESSSGSGNTRQKTLINYGMQSLALSCILCSSRSTVLHFILNGGIAALAGVFKLRDATPLMIRYALCTMELITLTAGPIGAEALIGIWRYGGEREDNDEKIEGGGILHVPGIVNAMLSKDNQKTPPRKPAMSDMTLPPGMVPPGKGTADDDDTPSEKKRTKEEDEVVSRKDQETKHSEREDSGRKKSSAKKKEKKRRKTKQRSPRDRSSEHRDSRRSRDDRESKKHRNRHRHSSNERQKRPSSKYKDKAQSNGQGNRSKERRTRSTPSLEAVIDSPNRASDSLQQTAKRQKCEHPKEQSSTSFIDLRSENPTLRQVPLYDLLVELLLQPRPQGVVHSVKRLLDRLNVYQCLSDLQAATNAIVAAVSGMNKPTKSCLPFSDISGVFSTIATCLGRILKFMKDSMKKRTDLETDNNADDDTEYNKGLVKEYKEFDAAMLEYLSSTDLLGHLKFLIHILHLSADSVKYQRKWNEQRGQILTTAARLLMMWTATNNGLEFLKHHAKVVSHIKAVQMRDVEEQGEGVIAVDGMQLFKSSLCFVRSVLDCSRRMQWILDTKVDSKLHLTAIQSLSNSATELSEQSAILCSLRLHPGLLHKLLEVANLLKQDVKTNEQSNAEGVDEAMTSVLRNDLSAQRLLSFHPTMLSEVVSSIDTAQRSIQSEKTAQTAMQAHRESLEYLDEMLGQIKVCQLYSDSGPVALVKELATTIPQRSTDSGSRRMGNIREEDSTALIRQPFELGRVTMMLNTLACLMMSSDLTVLTLSEIYGAHLLSTLERALLCAIEVNRVSNADALSAVLSGDFRNDLHLSRRSSEAMEFLCCVIRCFASTLRRLQRSNITVKSTGCMKSLIEAHSILCLDPQNLTPLLGRKPSLTSAETQAKEEIEDLLLLWMTSGWTPSVLDILFESSIDFNHYAKPVRLFTNSCLLGDLFRDEWPALPHVSLKRGYLAMPSNMKLRASLARGLEMHTTAFRYLVEFGLGSESHIFRCATVRLCARAAGLGGGMGMFLVEPVLTEIQSLATRNSSGGDYYRLVEIISALVPWPALKSAFLDMKLTSSLARLLHTIASECHKDSSLTAVCRAILDIFAILMDSNVAMDPFESEEARVHSDCPSASEMSMMVCTLLASERHLSGLQHKIIDLLHKTQSLPDSHSILSNGISRWRSASSAEEELADISFDALLDWALEKLESDGTGSVGNQNVIDFVMNISRNPRPSSTTVYPERQPAQARFKAIVLKTQKAVEGEVESDHGCRDDAAADVFWKFVHAFPPHPLKKSWAKLMCTGFDVAAPSQYYARQHFLAASCRPREVFFNPTLNRSSINMADTTAAATGERVRLHSDLPPVVALPRRGQEARRVKPGASSSRPPSIHVDEYDKPSEDDSRPSKSPQINQSPSPAAQLFAGKNDNSVQRSTVSESRIASPVVSRTATQPESSVASQETPARNEKTVGIPGIGSVNASSLIPGVGLSHSDQTFIHDADNPTIAQTRTGTKIKDHESDNSPTAPQLSQSSNDEPQHNN